MITGKHGMGTRKHRVSGRAPKSPKLRLAEKMEAEHDERKAKKTEMKESVADLFRPKKDRR